MTLKDLLTFVKAGYKPSDVKELLEMVKDEEPEKSAETSQKDEQQPEPEKAEPTSDTGSDDQIQQLQQKIRDLETRLTAAQSQNASKDLSGDEPDESEQLNDLIRSYM